VGMIGRCGGGVRPMTLRCSGGRSCLMHGYREHGEADLDGKIGCRGNGRGMAPFYRCKGSGRRPVGEGQ
jgi:hypothetical protein